MCCDDWLNSPFDFGVSSHHELLAPERDRENSIRLQTAALFECVDDESLTFLRIPFTQYNHVIFLQQALRMYLEAWK